MNDQINENLSEKGQSILGLAVCLWLPFLKRRVKYVRVGALEEVAC